MKITEFNELALTEINFLLLSFWILDTIFLLNTVNLLCHNLYF